MSKQETTKEMLEKLSGVGPATADKLIDAGYDRLQDIAVSSVGDLTKSSGANLGDNTAEKAISSARELSDIGGFQTGNEVLDDRREINKVSFRVPEIDNLLDGGVEESAITQFYGEFGAAKSQIVHQLCVNVQLPEKYGGTERRALVIDTEESFRMKRVVDMVRGLSDEILNDCMERDGIDGTVSSGNILSKRKRDIVHGFYEPDRETLRNLIADLLDRSNVELNNSYSQEIRDIRNVIKNKAGPMLELEKKFLSRVHHSPAFNSNHQAILVKKQVKNIEEKYRDTDFPIGLLAVDSIIGHFRAEYIGRGELADRQHKLTQHVNDLTDFASNHKVAVVLANQVQANPDKFFGNPQEASGGNVLNHRSTYRAMVRKSGDEFVMKLDDAPHLPDGEAPFLVENEGVRPS